jgi:ribose-phosphate pyrophosphokinase
MRIYTPAGDLAFNTFQFPDGQPHFKLETHDREFHTVNVETALKSPSDLFTLALAADVLRQHGYSEINLDIRYLLAARMDRAISVSEPFSLQLVARWINGLGFSKVRILDVHSDVALRLIRHSTNVLPVKAVEGVYQTLGLDTVIVTPDKGAEPRVRALFRDWQYRFCIMRKERDLQTGNLLGFLIKDGKDNVKDRVCLIVDDICDGGGTFVGQAKLLREHGASKVFLYVTHGIFSKGFAPFFEYGPGHSPNRNWFIDRIFCTDSFSAFPYPDAKLVQIPVSMRDL